MSTQDLKQFYIGKTAGELKMRKPKWWHHILAWFYATTAMLLTYALALEGLGLWAMLIPSAMASMGILYLYGQRLDHLQIGEKIDMGMKGDDSVDEETEDAILEYQDDE